MSEHYLVRIGSEGQPHSLLTSDAHSSCQIQKITNWSAAELKQKPLVILLPAAWVYQSQTHIASKSPEVLKKSIPFAVEEELSNEVEDNYFAFQSLIEGTQDVIAIEKKHLDEVVKQIRINQLNIKAIYSETDWLPSDSESVTLWCDDDSALLRFGDDAVMSVGKDQINQLIPLFKGSLKKLKTNQQSFDGLPDMEIDESLTESDCILHLFNHAVIDLYISELKEEPGQNQNIRWQSVYVLLTLLLTSWLGVQLFQWYQLDKQIQSIKQQQQNVLLQLFPDAAPSELNDPFAAVKSRMQLNQSQSNQKETLFLDVVYGLGAVKQQMKLIKLNGVRLQNQQIEVQISAPNITLINDFHQQLQNQLYAYRVAIGVNELGDDNIYKSVITVVPR